MYLNKGTLILKIKLIPSKFLCTNNYNIIFTEEQWKTICTLSDEYYPIFNVWGCFLFAVVIRHPDDLEVTKEIQFFIDIMI